MPQDFKLFKDENGYFKLKIENGKIVRTSGLDTALYLSIFSKARAGGDLVKEPLYRQGHFLDSLRNRRIGNLAWAVLDQGNITSENINFITNEYYKALQWLIDNNIAQEIQINIENQDGNLYANIVITGKDAQNTVDYNLLINT